MNDEQRFEENKLQFCSQGLENIGAKRNVKPRSDVTWLTIVVDEDFAVPALVLGHSIQTVSEGTRKALQSVGWDTRLVEEMDCEWLDAKVGGETQQWDDCWFSDQIANYQQEIMNLWRETTIKDTCPDDQVLLWHYYAAAGKWKALPFSFNIRLIIYRPLNSYHFAGGPRYHPPKPWSAKCRPSRMEASDFDRPILVVDDMVLIFWKNFYELLLKYNLEDWWRSTKLFRPDQQFGGVPYAGCIS
ncbi:hypothetical protein OS493_013152 [Desmophyllum pertusum]|uniref:Uncharacterized protein n=1 Tax=Desmophyllum pertusum TaxID=174260 RepID=A0A9X0CML8_9CNID|nr:hypothetical protein OS493_013152 [Desmophyllum pertusum]